jgi:hypothetical protein
MIIGLVMVVVLVEAVLMLLWNRRYFGWGVPVFRQRIAAPAAALSDLPFNWLAGEYPPARWATLVFEPLSRDTCGFREALLMPRGPGYLPVMRGLIVADRQRREVRVVGWCNWSVLLIAATLVASMAVMPAVALGLLGLLVASYLVQRRRFQNVATAVRALLEANRTLSPPITRTPPS